MTSIRKLKLKLEHPVTVEGRRPSVALPSDYERPQPLTASDNEHIKARAVSIDHAHAAGWHRSGDRIGIPVFDQSGAVANVRQYMPPPRHGKPKVLSTPGYGKPTRLAGIEWLRDDDDWVFVCGGEFDTAAAISAGLNAVNGTNGEGSVPAPEHGLSALANRRVAVALDADGPGRKAASVWARKLASIASEVRVIALPDDSDVNDWFVAGNTASALLDLVEAAPISHARGSARRDADELLQMALTKTDDGEGRNETGFWLACQLRDEGYSPDEAWEAAISTFQKAVEGDKEPHYTVADARVSLESAFSQPARQPSGRTTTAVMHPLTELGNAERFVERFGDRCKYIAALREWWVWDGRRWATDNDGQVDRWARETVRAISQEADATEDEELRKKVLAWARASESRSKLDNLTRLAQSETGVTASPADFDRDHDILNVANGVIDLRTGQFRAHQTEDMLHRMSPVTYDPTATSPGFDKFLQRVQPDPDMRAFLQRAAGYSATGHTTEHRFLMPYSDGRSGKSTFASLLFAVFGLNEYAMHLRPEALAVSKFEQIPADIARLVGARYVLTGELEEGMHLNESLVKSLTGGEDPISARLLHSNPITFFPQCTIWMPTNHRPVVRGTDEGIWGRHLLVSDWVFIPEPERDKNLVSRLKATELPGILNWIVAGAVEWYREGLNPPASVLAATQAYREESDLMGAFLDEMCSVGADEECTKSELYFEYTAWCREGGLKPLTKIAFGRALKKHPRSDITETRRGKSKVHMWSGVDVLPRRVALSRVTPISAAQKVGAN